MNTDEMNVPVSEPAVADNATTETEQIEIPTFDLIPDVRSTTVAPAQDEAPVAEEKPDEWFQVPQQFEDGKELDWYKERFNTVMQSVKPSKEYLDSILNSKVDELVDGKNQELEGYKEMFSALQTNPKAFMAQYLPEVLSEMGISPVLTPQQMFASVNSQLISEFGKDWQTIASNAMDRYNPNSNAYMIDVRYQQLMGELHGQNGRNESILSQWNQLVASKQVQMPNEMERAQTINNIYESEFKDKGFSREQFDGFMEEAGSRPMTASDIHHAVYFSDYMKTAYLQGIEAGKSGKYQSALRSGGREITPSSSDIPNSEGGFFSDSYTDAIRRGIF